MRHTVRLYPSGILFDPFDPRPELISVEDVAHGLAQTNRFNGHLPEPYSVAQHSVIVSRLCCRPLWGLLHDVAKALSGLGDVAGPVKRHPSINVPVKAIENRIESAAAVRFGLPNDFARSTAVKYADRLAYAWEDRDLRGLICDEEWSQKLQPMLPTETLRPVPWREARDVFVAEFIRLTSNEPRRIRLSLRGVDP